MGLSEARAEIDAIDAELVALFVRRMKAVAAVAEAKRESNAPVLDARREDEVLDRVARAAGPDFAASARRLYREIMSISRDRQQGLLAWGDENG